MTTFKSLRTQTLGPVFAIIRNVDAEMAEFFSAYASLKDPALRTEIAALVVEMAKSQDRRAGG